MVPDGGGEPAVDDLPNILAPSLRRFEPSGWHELVPVAHWLVAALEPRLLVELGTHAGVSFSAFCSAVQRLGLPTKAFAVDRWTGDPHAGAYGEEVYLDLQSFVGSRFGGFAQLLRQDFDGARDRFEDGSIDLLHIDGYHTFEAVSHDFEAWLPKLSARGVVALHDTGCRTGDFGVWKLWEEVSRRFPAFEFPHGNGLGLVAPGDDPPEVLRRLARDGDAAGRVATLLAMAGQFHGALYDLHVECGERLRLVTEDRRLVDEDRQRIDIQRLQQQSQIAALLDERQHLEAEAATLRTRADGLETQLAAMREGQSLQRRPWMPLPWRRSQAPRG